MEQKRSRTCAATMRDVALQAGVSTVTVSRALMRPEKVSPATLQRGRRAAGGVQHRLCAAYAGPPDKTRRERYASGIGAR